MIISNDTIDGAPFINKLSKSGIIEVIFQFCRSTDADLIYSGINLLLNLVSISKDLSLEMLDSGVILVVTAVLMSQAQPGLIQSMIFKILVSLVQLGSHLIYSDSSIKFEVVVLTIRPYLKSFIENADAFLVSFREELHVVKSNNEPLSTIKIELSSEIIKSQIECISLFISCKSFDEFYVDSKKMSIESYLNDQLPIISKLLMLFLDIFTFGSKETDKISLLVHSLIMCIANLTRLKIVCPENLFSRIMAIFDLEINQRDSATIKRTAVSVFGILLDHGLGREYFLTNPSQFFKLLKFTTIESNSLTWLQLRYISTILAGDLTHAALSLSSISNLRILPGLREIHNCDWTFATVICDFNLCASGKFAYEVKIKSRDVIQIGWATKDFKPEPFLGNGVGDNNESYSYDGHRCKKWFNKKYENNKYGREWHIGDIITALLNFEDQTMIFLVNGVSQGIAFSGFDTTKTYQPAVSLSHDQIVQFSFGSVFDELKFCPLDHIPLSQLRMTDHGNNNSMPLRISLLTEHFSNFNDDGDLEIIPEESEEIICTAPHYRFRKPIKISPSRSSENSSPGSAMTEIMDHSSSLKFYYEVQIGLEQARFTSRVGIRLEKGLLFCLTVRDCVKKIEIEKIVILKETGIASLHGKSADLVFDTEPNEVSGKAELEKNTLEVIHDVNLKTGDIVGCGWLLNRDAIVFTVNGLRIGGEISCLENSCCTPHVTGTTRFVLNFGNELFAYPQANLDRHCILLWKSQGP